MGIDYTEALRVIELSSGEDRITGYDRILLEVETFIKEDNIKVLREFTLKDDFANYLSNKDYYLDYGEIKLLKKVVKLLEIVDLDNIDNFLKFKEYFETKKLAELEKTHLDRLLPRYEEYNEDVFDLVTGRVLGYVEDNDVSELFERYDDEYGTDIMDTVVEFEENKGSKVVEKKLNVLISEMEFDLM